LFHKKPIYNQDRFWQEILRDNYGGLRLYLFWVAVGILALI